MSATEQGPWDIVDRLSAWARTTPWCEWLELGGSLAAGRGDQFSDVDAGLGVGAGMSLETACTAVVDAASGFAPMADSLLQHLGVVPTPAEHVIVQYRDGRQLSLVVLAAAARRGRPPGARVLFDRARWLDDTWRPPQLEASLGERREWAFLAWLNLGDATKHGRRGKVWRAAHSLEQARDYAWKLHTAACGVDYPTFGVVSAETAELPPPPGIEQSYPGEIDPLGIRKAVLGLAVALGPLTDGLSVEGIKAVIEHGLSADWSEAPVNPALDA